MELGHPNVPFLGCFDSKRSDSGCDLHHKVFLLTESKCKGQIDQSAFATNMLEYLDELCCVSLLLLSSSPLLSSLATDKHF